MKAWAKIAMMPPVKQQPGGKLVLIRVAVHESTDRHGATATP